MKAAVLTAYGAPDRLVVQEVAPPSPAPGQVRIRVHATTVTAGDTEIRSSKMPWLFKIPIRIWLGIFKPRGKTILGMEVAGTIDALGEGVDTFAVGDPVFAACDMGLGGYAEHVCLPASGVIARKPENLTFEEAAAVPIGGLAALGYLEKGGIAAGTSVLIRGASGSIGTFAVQLAKHFGAHVTGVCGTQGVERVRALGADAVIDYTQTDFQEKGVTYDLILDVVGKMPISRCLKSVKRGGAYVRGTIPGVWELCVALWTRLTSRKRVVMGDAGDSPEGLKRLAALLESEALQTVVDRTYPIEAIAEAHRYVDTGHKQGNVIIQVTS